MPLFSSRGDEIRTAVYVKVVREIVLWGLLIASCANAFMMIGLFGAGIFEAGSAVRAFFQSPDQLHGSSSPDKAAMVMGLKAIELFLLAPLGYLFTSALAAFIQALVEDEGNNWTRAFEAVVGVKSLATSMLLSIIAVDFVGKILENDVADPTKFLVEGGIFLILLLYLSLLERKHHHKDGPTSD